MLQDTGFHSGSLETPNSHIFRNKLSTTASKDNGIQSGSLGMWPQSTIFGSSYHDLGQTVLPILEFTGTAIALDGADEIVTLSSFFLLCIIILYFFYIHRYFGCQCVSIKYISNSF